MPGIHHRRQLNLSDLFGNNPDTKTTASAASSTDAAAGPSASDNAGGGGILGGLSGILNGPASSTESPSTSPSVASTPAPASQSDTTQTTTLFSTSTRQTSSSGVASPSTSATDDDNNVGHTSKVAAAVVGTLIGILGLAMIIAFFLRRWNRHKRRAARESINFNVDQFLSPQPPPKDEPFVESKETYADGAMNTAYQFPSNPAPVYPHAGGYHYQQQAQPQQAPQPVYSPRPHHGYQSEAQRIMYDYQGQEAATGAGPYPNPHDRDSNGHAYGGV